MADGGVEGRRACLSNPKRYCITASQQWVLTWVDGAIFAGGGEDTGKRIAGLVLNPVTGQQFELLRCDWREAIELEGEVDVAGPIGPGTRCRYSAKRWKQNDYSGNEDILKGNDNSKHNTAVPPLNERTGD